MVFQITQAKASSKAADRGAMAAEGKSLLGGRSLEAPASQMREEAVGGAGGGARPRSSYLFTVFGDSHTQGVLTAGLCSPHHSKNLPEGQRGHIHKQEDPHDFGDPIGNGASFVKHHSLYLSKQSHLC